MSKKKIKHKMLQLKNTFQNPGIERPDIDLSSKWTRADIVLKFLEEKERNES